MTILQGLGWKRHRLKQDPVQLLDVRHQRPFTGVQIGVMTRFQQREHLLFPLGTFLQELSHGPFLLRSTVEQHVEHQQFPGSLGIVQTLQGRDLPSAGGLNQTTNLVTITVQHFTRHLHKKMIQLTQKNFYIQNKVYSDWYTTCPYKVINRHDWSDRTKSKITTPQYNN